MKINWKVRIKNPYFWIGLCGVIVTTVGIKPEDITSWSMIFEEMKRIVGNPFLLMNVVLAVMGVIADPTTKGICDSKQAMTYTKPKDDNSSYIDSDFGQ
ncbi:phage holin [Anaerotignum sp.]|uniref:phage holin n=1 Tax=Anaerotignum sp. TaxID=2039241 RepID=UPI0033186D4B